MQSYSRFIDDFIASQKELTDGEKMFMGLLHCLTGRFGYCFATNEKLAEYSFKTPRQIRRYIQNLASLGYIVIEIDRNFYRRIWTSDRYANKSKYLNSSLKNDDFENSTMVDMDVQGGGHGCPHIYKAYNKSKDKVGRWYNNGDAVGASKITTRLPASSKIENKKAAPKNKSPPPTPKPKPKPSGPKAHMTLTEHEKNDLIERMGYEYFEKYEKKAREFLSTANDNAYSNLTFAEVIWQFHAEDLEKRIKRKEEKKKEKERAAGNKAQTEDDEKQAKDKHIQSRRKHLHDLLTTYPNIKGLKESDYCVFVKTGTGSAFTIYTIAYNDDRFYEKVDEYCLNTMTDTGHMERVSDCLRMWAGKEGR